MARSARSIGVAAALTVAASLTVAQDAKVDTPAAVAAALRVVVEPSYRWRYAQGGETYEWPSRSLLTRRRAFAPGENLRFSFELPAGKPPAPVTLKATFLATDLDGRKVADLGAVEIRASAASVEGSLEWTVPSHAPEGNYFLAAHFVDAEGRAVLTRSEIVFVAPEYPSLLAAAQAAVARAVAARGSMPALVRDVSLPSVEMLLEDAQMHWSDFGRAPRDWDYVKEHLVLAKRYAEELAAGGDPWLDAKGTMVKAYRSELDDTLQPYGLYVPKNYDPSRAYPLVVSLHGATSHHLLNRRRVFGLGNRPGEGDYEAIRNEVTYPDVDFIVATPYGRGEVAGYTGIGEKDVLRVLADVERAYHVDTDRVHLTGLSMGGGGTWHIGLRYPDRFASLTPVCAVAYAGRFVTNPTAEDKALMDLTSAYAVAENAGNLRVFIYHGDEDPAVPVEQSRRMAQAFEGFGWLGRTAQFFELPGVHHFAWDLAYRDASLFERVKDIRRVADPDHVVYVTHSPRFNKAYWLRIDRIDKGLELARIEGERKQGNFEVRSRNLSAFSILLDPAIAPPGKPITVAVDGKPAYSGTPKGAVLSFRRDGAGAFAAKPWVGPALGPPDHAEAGMGARSLAEASAHVYVYGTTGSAEETAVSKRRAETLADWRPGAKARWQVLADKDVTPATTASQDLVLLGNARTNAVVARLGARLPLRDDATGVHAGVRKVADADAVYRLLAPNPEAPSRYVLVYGAAGEAAYDRVAPVRRELFRSALGADYLVLGADGSVKLSGLFRNAWRVEVP
jgi:poly(3-hydroxybutyrate) depolymerase